MIFDLTFCLRQSTPWCSTCAAALGPCVRPFATCCRANIASRCSTIGLLLASRVGRVIGLELIAEAIDDAKVSCVGKCLQNNLTF